jgi:hypothetical protein
MAYEDPILTLLSLHSQQIAECARRNREVTKQLINEHIHLTSLPAIKPSSIQIATVRFLSLRLRTNNYGSAVLTFNLRFFMKTTSR